MLLVAEFSMETDEEKTEEPHDDKRVLKGLMPDQIATIIR